MKKELLLSLFIGSVLSAYAYAQSTEKPAVHPGKSQAENGCKETQNRLNVYFPVDGDSFSDANNKVHQRLEQIQEIAKEGHIANLTFVGAGYDYNAQRNPRKKNNLPPPYGIRAIYKLDSSTQAFKLGDLLAQQKMHVSVGLQDRCSAETLPQEDQ